MGLFLFIAAVMAKDPLEIATSIKLYLDQNGFYSSVKEGTKWREEVRDQSYFDAIDPPALTAIFNPKNNFSCISFDNCPFQEIEVCKYVSLQLNTVISLIEVYDSTTWYHRLFQRGDLIDKFCNNPQEYEAIEKTHEFKGKPGILSNIFAINKLEIEEYLFQFTPKNREYNYLRKISPSDEYPLGNEWFFVDFWRKLGIEYPKTNPQIILIHKIK